LAVSDKRYTYATGRRKEAVARVQLHEGTGQIIVNGRPFADALPRLVDQTAITEPFRATNTVGRFSVMAKITGGGTSGWTGALVQGISRALALISEENRLILRRGPFLTRDARVKERKKYGLKRARKAPQYTKR
jgi:small subunit ribosomal protein S9